MTVLDQLPAALAEAGAKSITEIVGTLEMNKPSAKTAPN